MSKPDINEWIQVGVLNGWCTLPVCSTHDGVPNTEEEEQEWEDGFDPCQIVIRLWV